MSNKDYGVKVIFRKHEWSPNLHLYFSDDSKSTETDTNSSKKIYDLTASVQVWSDFLRPHLHPNAIYLFDNFMLNGGRAAEETGGDIWGFSSGYSAFQREEAEEEVTDRIRCLAESCNSLQVSVL